MTATMVCIFEHVQWRWARNDRLAPGLPQVHWSGIEESASALIHVVACIDIFRPRAKQMVCFLGVLTRSNHSVLGLK